MPRHDYEGVMSVVYTPLALGQSGVRCLAQGSHLSRGHFLPDPGFEPTTLGYLGFQVQHYPLGHDYVI